MLTNKMWWKLRCTTMALAASNFPLLGILLCKKSCLACWQMKRYMGVHQVVKIKGGTNFQSCEQGHFALSTLLSYQNGYSYVRGRVHITHGLNPAHRLFFHFPSLLFVPRQELNNVTETQDPQLKIASLWSFYRKSWLTLILSQSVCLFVCLFYTALYSQYILLFSGLKSILSSSFISSNNIIPIC